jgi:hypothetical protein
MDYAGVRGRSILLELPSIRIPRSFPIDIMHLFFLNVAENMVNHWLGNFFKHGKGVSEEIDKEESSKDDCILHKSTWRDMGLLMHAWLVH